MAQPGKEAQHYGNHIRFYPPHHFVFLPLVALLIGSSTYCAAHFPERRLEWIGFAIAFFMLGFLAFILRQHYAIGNQNRIIRLELRLRYFQITGQRLEPAEAKLSIAQLMALRFAPDEELPELLQAALAEQLSPDAIKRRVKNWLPDHMRG